MFWLLSTSRASGMSVGYIPLSEVILAANTFERMHDLELHCKVINAMDIAYVASVQKKDK